MDVQLENLTPSNALDILSLLSQSGAKLKGTIRTKERCPKCREDFMHYPKLGFICPECKTVPKRVFIDLYHKGYGRVKIYSDKQGEPLDTYSRALSLQETITTELKTGTFNPTNYVKKEQKQFWCITLLDEMYADRIDNIAPSNKAGYKRMVEIEKAYFGTKNVKDILNYDIINFDKHLQNVGYKENGGYKNANTRNKVLEHFKSFINYCIFDRQIPGIMMPKFPELDITQPVIHWLNMEDQQIIFNDFVPEEHKPIISFLLIYGCRPSEARAMKCKDVDLANDCFTISSSFSGKVYREKKRKGRGSKPTTKPIHDEIREYIEDRVRNNHPEAWLFIHPLTGNAYGQASLYRLWSRIREKADIPNYVRLYDATRHSRGSQEANNGVPLQTVQELLGHSNDQMTKRYMHLLVDTQRTVLRQVTLKKGTVPRVSLLKKQDNEKP